MIFEPYELFIENFNLNFKIKRDYHKNFHIYNTMNVRTLKDKYTDISIYAQFFKKCILCTRNYRKDESKQVQQFFMSRFVREICMLGEQ